MKYKNNDYHAREASALKGAANLLGVIEWRIKDEPALLPPALREGLNAPDADLVIVPSGGSYPHGLEMAVRETRATILIVEPGSTSEGSPTYYFTLVRCVGGKVCWTSSLRLWVSGEGNPYLVPDEHGDDPNGTCFALVARGVATVPPPWSDKVHYDLGINRGDAVLLAP